MKPYLVAGIVLSVLFVVILGLYLSSYKNVSKDTLIFLLSILQVIAIFFIFFSPMSSESFFFEVSPERKKCLVEQVSLDKSRRSCSCCQKGTVGGILPHYAEWLQPEGNNELWKRTDNWTTDPTNVAYESQLPATERVRQMKKNA